MKEFVKRIHAMFTPKNRKVEDNRKTLKGAKGEITSKISTCQQIHGMILDEVNLSRRAAEKSCQIRYDQNELWTY